MLHNVGIGIGGDVEELAVAHWDRVIDVNLRGVVHGVQAAYPMMVHQRDGHIEVWFGIIERQAIHRGSFASVADLNRRIRTFTAGWNDRCHPFVWTKTAEQIPAKTNRQKTSDAPH